jgi:hypothetical protein
MTGSQINREEEEEEDGGGDDDTGILTYLGGE